MAGYGSDSDLAAWAEANGFTVPDGIAPAVLRQRGSDWLDGTYGDRFPGYRTGGYQQERAWPRSNAVLASGETVPSDVVPVAIINASFHAAFAEASQPGMLFETQEPGKVLKKLDKIEWEVVGAKDGSTPTFVLPAVEGLLTPFLVAANGHLPSILVV